MKKVTMIALLLATAMAGSALAEDTVRVGGQPMYPSKNIIQNAVNSADHTTLVAVTSSTAY